jgi:hypothetical protein
MAIELSVLTTIFGILGSIVGTAAMVWKAVIAINQRADEKADRLREQEEKRASELRIYTDRTATDLRLHNETTTKEILKIMQDMDQKLTTRANLTNGNVSNIRKDLLELSEEIENLYYYNDTHSGNGGIGGAVRKRQNAKKRKRRLDQIDRDRKSQEHPDIMFGDSDRNYRY